MKRGDIYRVHKPSPRDPRKFRAFVVVSRQILIDSKFSTVICAPIYSVYDGLSTQMKIGHEVGLKHDSSIHCDELISISKPLLTQYIGTLAPQAVEVLNRALKVSLEIS